MIRRTLSLPLAIACLAGLTAASAAPASVSADSSSEAAAAKKKRNNKPSRNRLGGRVRQAWPAPGAKRKPKTPLTRWLARQVGPQKVVPCKKRPRRARKRCNARPMATTAAVGQPAERIETGTATGQGRLSLVRSFDIPLDDPSYARLLNWSWTYDSALVATAFSSVGLSTQAARVLDQLRRSPAQERSDRVCVRCSDWREQQADPLSLRNDEGLVRGGPDVKWVSTQHNLLTFFFLTNLSETLQQHGDQEGADAYRAAAEELAKGIESRLLVRDDGLLPFRQGVEDEVLPLDAQALGVIYGFMRQDHDLAKQVYTYAQENFQVSGRSIELSSDPASFNMTDEAKGPFSGYRPYLGEKTPRTGPAGRRRG